MSLNPNDISVVDRRRFLKRTAFGMPVLHRLCGPVAAGAALSATGQAYAAESASDAKSVDADSAPVGGLDPMARRRLHLINAHTKDDLDVVYFTQGIYIDENISQLNHLMRDRRANITGVIDPALYDQLLGLQIMLGTTEPVHVLSGYRTAETNAKLRRRSSGVAKFSLHMEGRAADIYIPGIPAKTIHAAALEMGAGGVGLYSRSNFVHMDTGPVRQWGK